MKFNGCSELPNPSTLTVHKVLIRYIFSKFLGNIYFPLKHNNRKVYFCGLKLSDFLI
jgi:hypothetical protein